MIETLVSLDRLIAVAHRGGSALRPENTIAAFDHACELGVDAAECDVHLSRDEEPIVIHDPTLDRTTDAAGPVQSRTAEELARVDAGFHFGAADGYPYRGRSLGIPRLRDLLARYPDLPFIVEIKGGSLRAAERTVEVLRASGSFDRVIVGGFNHQVLEKVRTLAPTLFTSASQQEAREALTRSHFRLRPRRPGFRILQMPFRLRGRQMFRRSFVRTVRRAGVPVQAWVVDDPHVMRQLILWGVTGIISDRPDIAVEVVRTHTDRAKGKGQRAKGS